MTVGTRIQQRGDLAVVWADTNPVLLVREIGYETDTGKSKMGDGTTAWNSLPYQNATLAAKPIDSLDGRPLKWNKTTGLFEDGTAAVFSGIGTFLVTVKTGAAIQTAIDAAKAAGGGIVQLTAGAYQLSGSLTIDTATDITIVGAGANTTKLVVNGNYNAITVTGVCSRIFVRDMWIGSFVARTSGYGISVTGTSGIFADSIHLRNLLIQNTSQAVYFQYVSTSIWRDVSYLQSISSAAGAGPVYQCISTVSVRMDWVLATSTAGQIAGDGLVLDSNTDTFVMSAVNIANVNVGIKLTNSAGGAATGPRLVRLTDCYVESCTSHGFSISDGRDVRLIACHSAVNHGSGYSITGGTGINVVGGIALSNDMHGFYLAGAAVKGAALVGVTASNNSQATSVTYDGIRIDDNTSHVRVTGNRSGDFVFTLTNKQRYGLSISATGTDYISAQGNDFSGNTTDDVNDLSTGANNSVEGTVASGNIGIVRTYLSAMPVNSLTLTIGSPNTTRYFRVVEGGTISKIRLGVGTSSGNISVAVHRSSGRGLTAVPGAQVATSGSIACPASGIQDVALGSTVNVRVGDWLAIGADNTTATFYGVVATGASGLVGGQAGVASGFPAPATPSFTAGDNRAITLVGAP